MTQPHLNLVERVKDQLAQAGLADLFALAITHASTLESTAQSVLSYLGLAGIKFALAWNDIRFNTHRDAGSVSVRLDNFNASSIWVDSILTENALSVLRVGKGMQNEQHSSKLRRQFLCAIVGASFRATASNFDG